MYFHPCKFMFVNRTLALVMTYTCFSIYGYLIKLGNYSRCQLWHEAMYLTSGSLILGKQNSPRKESQPLQGKKMFQAKVTENIPVGFTIETIIDGKPLRGILFSNKSNSYLMANHDYSR